MAIQTDTTSRTIVQTITHQSTTEAASGDNELVAAPAAGSRIVVCYFAVQNESSTATVVLMKDGSNTRYRKVLEQYDGYGRAYEHGREWRLTAATALNVNLDGANSHNVDLEYFTETVG